MQVFFQDEVMQIAGFMVRVSDEYDDLVWSYGIFDTYDQAQDFTTGLAYSVIEPIYRPAKH